jgi:hypothetical protein
MRKNKQTQVGRSKKDNEVEKRKRRELTRDKGTGALQGRSKNKTTTKGRREKLVNKKNK